MNRDNTKNPGKNNVISLLEIIILKIYLNSDI